MPKCSNCSHAQSRLSKSGLCKSCNNNNIYPIVSVIPPEYNNLNKIKETHLSDELDDDRTIIELTKTNMVQDKARNDEIINLLKSHIEFLKPHV